MMKTITVDVTLTVVTVVRKLILDGGALDGINFVTSVLVVTLVRLVGALVLNSDYLFKFC